MVYNEDLVYDKTGSIRNLRARYGFYQKFEAKL